MADETTDSGAGERHPDMLMCNGVESREDCDNDLHWVPATPDADDASEVACQVCAEERDEWVQISRGMRDDADDAPSAPATPDADDASEWPACATYPNLGCVCRGAFAGNPSNGSCIRKRTGDLTPISAVSETTATPDADDASECCEHAVKWHHETRGCGYHGHGPDRCPCLLTADEALEHYALARESAAATRARAEVGKPMTSAEQNVIAKAFERDRWAGEWNSLPTAIDNLLRNRAARIARGDA